MDMYQQVGRVLEFLTLAIQKPGMYIGSYRDTGAFLNGFRVGCSLAGLNAGFDETYQAVLRERGWGKTTIPEQEMRAKGLDDLALCRELLMVELQVWQRRYQRSSSNGE